MGATISKKIIVPKPSIPPYNQSIKVHETPEIQKNNIFTWNQRIILWKDSDSRLGRL